MAQRIGVRTGATRGASRRTLPAYSICGRVGRLCQPRTRFRKHVTESANLLTKLGPSCGRTRGSQTENETGSPRLGERAAREGDWGTDRPGNNWWYWRYVRGKEAVRRTGQRQLPG